MLVFVGLGGEWESEGFDRPDLRLPGEQNALIAKPEKELKAFAKVALAPGERQTVTFSIPREALAYFNDQAHAWVAEAGEFEVLVGASSQDIRAASTFVLTDTSSWL